MAHKDNGSEYNTPSVLGWLKMCIRVHQHFANGNQRHAKLYGRTRHRRDRIHASTYSINCSKWFRINVRIHRRG